MKNKKMNNICEMKRMCKIYGEIYGNIIEDRKKVATICLILGKELSDGQKRMVKKMHSDFMDEVKQIVRKRHQ